jgi:hypothetical protein
MGVKTVKTLHLTQDRVIRVEKATLIGKNLIIENGNGYLRGTSKDSLNLFLKTHVERDNDSEIAIEDFYQKYKDFCNREELKIHPYNDKFIKQLEKYFGSNGIEIDSIAGVIKNIRVSSNGKGIKTRSDDIWFLEKRTLFGKRYIPVFLTIEGTATTHNFDNVVTYGENAHNELVVVDDSFLGRIVGGVMSLGSQMGKQEALQEMRRNMLIVTILSVGMLTLLLYVLFKVQGIWDVISRII